MRRHVPILLSAALLTAFAVAHVHSCGDDFFFHLQSWYDAAFQLRHGTLYPHWLFHGAYNAGEPRFVFYPPLSWELGGFFALVMPFAWVPNVIAFTVFCIAGLATYRLVRPWGSEAAAVLAGCLFLANPYLMLDLVSRAAYGQAFATAFAPLLLAAMLRPAATVWRLGLPLALMWLCNVPLGILGMYLFLLLGAWRTGAALHAAAPGDRRRVALHQLGTLGGGGSFGLALPAFFLVPAIWERRYIRMQDAFLPRLRVTDNLLGHRTLDPGRDAFLLLTQHVAELLAAATTLALAAAAWRLLREQKRAAGTNGTPPAAVPATPVLLLVAGLGLFVLFSITFLSAPLWKHLPALWVVQFPWRLLFVLGLCFALSVALLLRDLRLPSLVLAGTALLVSGATAFPAALRDQRPCDYPNAAAAFADGLARNHTLDAVNEYVVAGGDNGAMRPDNPPFWLTPDPQAFAPGTTPNLSDVDPSAEAPEAPADAHLTLTSLQFAAHAPTPEFLVLNLQDYARWTVRAGNIEPPHTHRPDGLIAIPVPAGDTAIAVTWHTGFDEVLGWVLSGLAVAAFAGSRWIRNAAVRRARQSTPMP